MTTLQRDAWPVQMDVHLVLRITTQDRSNALNANLDST